MTSPITPPPSESLPRPARQRALRLAALAVIVVLAAALRCTNLSALGLGNHYYAAAVASMQTSWRNFFFVAAEPGGSVSVDKPPVGLWLQAITVHFLGMSGLALLLPELLAGIGSVILLYHLARRSFGTTAGLLAALALAITPVVVATDRNNTIDSTLILTLLLAAWAFIVATESGKLRHLLLGALIVGIAFNIKMLQAFLPLPAFYALYLLGAKERPGRKVGKLALASVLLAVVSLSWALIVDLTPADQRPYVGSSSDNSEMSLMIGYNGVDRLLGALGRRGMPGGSAGNPGFPAGAPGRDGGMPFGGARDGARQPFGGGSGGMGGGPNSGTGSAGPQRLFTTPLSKEVSWLLPFGLLSCVLLLIHKWRWPLGPQHQALVLWGGWLLTSGVFFSIAGFFHEYYMSMLAPPLAVLVGIGVAELWQLRQKRPWLGVGLLLTAVGATLWFQVVTARAFVNPIRWWPIVLALFVGGAVLLSATILVRRVGKLAWAGFALVVAAMLLTPGIWSVLTNQNPSENQSLPSAYSGGSYGPVNRGTVQLNEVLLDYLESHTQDVAYLMAVPSSMQGADYVLATGRPVLYLGGFMGVDEVVTADQLDQLVCQGQLRYIYWDASGAGAGNRSDISAWVTSRCTAVQGFDTTTRNAGAPDGTATGPSATAPGQNRGVAGVFGNLERVTLYECSCVTATP